MTDSIDLATAPVRSLNHALHTLPKDTNRTLWRVLNPRGQHALAVGVDAPIRVEIAGHAGYYCAGMNKGATIVIEGNAGNGVAENMMSGVVDVRGDASAAAGATAHGGMLVIRGNAAARCGISMKGIDILVETARMWADLGFWRSDEGGTFHIHGVTGPDEYTTVVNDNLFTNVMARFNLRRAAGAVRDLKKRDEAAYEQFSRRLGLEESELQEWERAAAGMAIPFDAHLGIHPQDLHFLEREVWDLGNTPMEKRPLLLNYHPLVIYRFQVLKQADVVLALFLQGEHFTAEEKLADFEYYDPITTGDSTLSAVVQSIIAAEVGYHDLAIRYFLAALFVDLADRHSNTSDGVHVASVGGVWSALVCGFGGFRDQGGIFTIDPRLPEEWDSLTYRVTLKGSRVRVTVTPEAVELLIEDGKEASLVIRGKAVTVTLADPVTVSLKDQGPRLEGEPRPPSGTRRADGTIISAIVPSAD